MERPTVTFAAVALVVLAATAMAPAAQEKNPFEAMDALRLPSPMPAPDVAFQSLDGRPVHVSQFRGRPVLLTFFTTW